MMQIGDFSRLGRVTVKTLRHYDRIGLLKPIKVDQFTNYRYYNVDQFGRLEQILMLKDLGLSLEQIAEILDGGLSDREMRGMLKMKQAELRTTIDEQEAQLNRIDAWLESLKRINNMTTNQDITIKNIPAQHVLAWRGIIDHPGLISEIFAAANRALPGANIPIAPADWLALYYHDGYRETSLDFEIAIPVEAGFDGALDIGDGRTMTVRELAPATLACMSVHLREQEDIRIGNQALARWVEENGYHYTDDMVCREAYGKPALPDGSIIFELQFPVKKA